MKKTPPNHRYSQPNDAQTNSAKIRAARAHVRFCLATDNRQPKRRVRKKCNAFCCAHLERKARFE